ncbi:MAG: ATP-binding cassette domain-containing protein [Caldilineales bacterium]
MIGAGRTEIARTVWRRSHHPGEILINSQKVAIRSPRDAIGAGIALVPENRKFDGLFFNFTGGPNISSAALKQITTAGLLQMRREEKVCHHYIDDLQISGSAAGQLVTFLSGGNQQKVVIARWLFANSGTAARRTHAGHRHRRQGRGVQADQQADV